MSCLAVTQSVRIVSFLPRSQYVVFILRKNIFTYFLMSLLTIYYSYLNNSINVAERGPGSFI